MRHNREGQERRMAQSRVKEESPRNGVHMRKHFLPTIKKGNGGRNKMMMSLMNTTNSKPLMFNNNRSLLF
jgi:hypothetical protein